jgi:hypothetical protein
MRQTFWEALSRLYFPDRDVEDFAGSHPNARSHREDLRVP